MMLIGTVAADERFVKPRLNRWSDEDQQPPSTVARQAVQISERAYQNAAEAKQAKQANQSKQANQDAREATPAGESQATSQAASQVANGALDPFVLPPDINVPQSMATDPVKQVAYNQFGQEPAGVVEAIDAGEYVIEEGGADIGGYFDNGHFVTERFMQSDEYYDIADEGYCDSRQCAPACGPGGCLGIDSCSRWWVRSEYLLWRITGFQTPPLISRSPSGTGINDSGVIGVPGTEVLFGGQTVNNDSLSGVRVSLGWYLDQERRKSIALSFFDLGSISENTSATGGILARPFFSVDPASTGPNSELVSYPGVLDGSISAAATTSMQGASAEVMQVLSQMGNRRIGVSAGYAYYYLKDDVSISDRKETLDSSLGLAVGTRLSEHDQFTSTNRYNGFTLGTNIMVCHRRWTFDAAMKMALGQTKSKASLGGHTTVSVPTADGVDTTTTSGGLLVLGSNAGSYDLDQFAMVPQLGFDLGFFVTPRMSLHFGYDFIYWSRVARAGELINSSINLSQVAPGGLSGTASPQFQWRFDDLAIHALDFGLTYRF